MHVTRPLQTIMASLATKVSFVEKSCKCSDGMELAYRLYEASSCGEVHNLSRRNIICLHGWLDNAASFHLVAPGLIERNVASKVVAVDFPGHGLSLHKSADGPTQVTAEYAYYVAEAIRQLELEQPVTLLGHSMGAGVAMVYASAFPDAVESLVLVEGFAPLARNAKDVSKHVRSAIETRLRNNPRLFGQEGTAPSKGRLYPDLETAITSRINTAKSFPGDQYISYQAARVLVERATLETDGGVTFRHDPRLNWPSLHYFCHEQVLGLLEAVQTPTCLIQAKNGWPFDEDALSAVRDILKPQYLARDLPGSHHLHADPDDAPAVIDHIEKFLDLLTSQNSLTPQQNSAI